MRVVLDAVSAREGGGQTYLRNLLMHDPGEGVEVAVLAPPSLTLPGLGAGVARVAVPEAVVRPLPRAGWGRVGLPRLLRDLRPDVFFAPGGTLPGRLPPGCRSITMSRNMLPFDAAQRSRYPFGYPRAKAHVLEPVLLRSMLRADLVVFVSEYARQVIQRRAGGRLGRTEVIPHGVGDEFRPSGGSVQRPQWLPPEDYVLYVSNFEPYKSHLQVVRAFASVRERRGGPERLVLVGRESVRPYAREVRAEITRLGLGQHVVLAGPLPHAELAAVYRHAHVGIFASQCENCPNILLEAMAAALPLAVSDRGPMPEFGGDAVAYFDPSRPDEIAARLTDLLNDRALAATLAKRAAARASLYDWAMTARRTWDVTRAVHAS